jgi:hypothetical protein
LLDDIGKKLKISTKVDFLTNKDRWKNGLIWLANLCDLHQSDYQKSRSYDRKIDYQANDFWQKI